LTGADLLTASGMDDFGRHLEETVVRAWPAPETLDVDGWLLRASGGPTQRGNSVSTLSTRGELSLPARIAQTEAWYREREHLPRFQIGPCCAPAELDQALAERGYRSEGESWAMSASARVVDALCPQTLETRIEHAPSERWLSIAAHQSRHAASAAIFQGFLARLDERCRCVSVCKSDGTPIATGLGIASPGQLGIYAMFTLPQQRRNGAGKNLLGALARLALAENTPELYLLVEAENPSARGLYAQAGFIDRYPYHYRIFDDARRGVSFC
jgi:GNAT superfamily N-acetyltransferase